MHRAEALRESTLSIRRRPWPYSGRRRTPSPCQQPPTEVVVEIDDLGVEVSSLDRLVVLRVQGEIDLVSCGAADRARRTGPTTHVIGLCSDIVHRLRRYQPSGRGVAAPRTVWWVARLQQRVPVRPSDRARRADRFVSKIDSRETHTRSRRVGRFDNFARLLQVLGAERARHQQYGN